MRKRLPPEIGRPSFGLLLSMLGLVRGLGEWRRDIGTSWASSSQPYSQEDSLFPIGVEFFGGMEWRMLSWTQITLIPQTLTATQPWSWRQIRIPGGTAAATRRRPRRPTILSSDAAMSAQEHSSSGARAELSRAHDKRTNTKGPRAHSARRRPWSPEKPLVTWAESPEEDEMAHPRPQGLGIPPGLHQAAVAAGGGAQAAVAAGGGAQAAVAATRADLDALRVTQLFRTNNAALKWIRDTSENPPGFPTTQCVDLTDADPMYIGVLERNTGMAYSFRGGGATQPWSWREMLAAFKPEVKDRILGTDRSVGVTRITCEAIGGYDHKRWHAARHNGTPFAKEAPVPVWDFHVYRTDNVVTRFHTSLTNNKVEVATVDSGLVLPGPPKAGKGKSDGEGTYKAKTTGNYQESYRGTGVVVGSAVAEFSVAEFFQPKAPPQADASGPPQADASRPPQADASGPPQADAAGARAQQAASWEPKAAWWEAKAAWWEAKQEPASPAGSAWGGADWWSNEWKESGHGNGVGGATASGSASSSAAAASTDEKAKWKEWGWSWKDWKDYQ